MAGAGDDASPRPNLDRSPETPTDRTHQREHKHHYLCDLLSPHSRGCCSRALVNPAHQNTGCWSGCLLCQSVQWWVLQTGCCNNPASKVSLISLTEGRPTCVCVCAGARPNPPKVFLSAASAGRRSRTPAAETRHKKKQTCKKARREAAQHRSKPSQGPTG